MSDEAGTPQRLVDIDVEVCQLEDGDCRFTSFFSRKASVPLEIASMEDYLISRSELVSLDRVATVRPEPEPRAPAESSPPVLRSVFRYEVVIGNIDHHFRVVANAHDGLELRFLMAIRPGLRYAFTACYVLARPPLVQPPGVINCYRLRCVPLSGEVALDALVESILREEISAFGTDQHGPHVPSLVGMEHLGAELERRVSDGSGRLVHNYREGSIGVEIDLQKARAADRAVHEVIRGLAAEAMSFLPVAPRGRPAAADPAQLQHSYCTILAACDRLLGSSLSWPPTKSKSAAVILAQQHFGLSSEHALAVGQLLRQGQRRPRSRRLAIRVLSIVTGLSERRLSTLVRK